MSNDHWLTRTQFCELECMSETSYLKLRRRGLGPEEVRILGTNIIRITLEARAAWHKQMAVMQVEQAAALEDEQRKKVARARDAADKALASPRHISHHPEIPR